MGAAIHSMVSEPPMLHDNQLVDPFFAVRANRLDVSFFGLHIDSNALVRHNFPEILELAGKACYVAQFEQGVFEETDAPYLVYCGFSSILVGFSRNDSCFFLFLV